MKQVANFFQSELLNELRIAISVMRNIMPPFAIYKRLQFSSKKVKLINTICDSEHLRISRASGIQ